MELQNRKDYIFNPETTDWELHDLNDVILIEFPSFEYVYKSFNQMKEIWEEAINK